ncbi:MAG: protoglobin domain-containing protein [Anaerolineae bacterium]
MSRELELLNELKDFVGFTDEDARLLADMQPMLTSGAPAVAEAFYANLLRFPTTRKVLDAEYGRVKRLKRTNQVWFTELGNGEYGAAYAARRYAIGKVHVRVHLPSRYMVLAMNVVRGMALQMVDRAYAAAADREARKAALNKILDIDLAMMVQSYDDWQVSFVMDALDITPDQFAEMMEAEYERTIPIGLEG